jgi:hypothetical protein
VVAPIKALRHCHRRLRAKWRWKRQARTTKLSTAQRFSTVVTALMTEAPQ